MKLINTIICLLISGISFGQSAPRAGRLKVSIETIKCINKSWDGVVEFDGHGNEISVACSFRIYNPANPGAARRGADGTVIYGSNVNGMTRAGTQTPDLGGITNGDVVNIFKPIIDEHINADEYIIIAPTVWEWDGPEKNTINSFNAQLETDLTWVTNQTYPFMNASISSSDPFAGRAIKIYDKYPYGQAIKYHNIFKNFLCPIAGQGNKPVDLRVGHFNNQCMVIYPPTLLVLDTRVLNALASNNNSASQSSAGRLDRPNHINGVTIPFIEKTYVIETQNGSYSLFLKIEFIPDTGATSASGLTSTSTKLQTTIKKDFSIKSNNSFLQVAGVWVGTQTNDYGMYPQNIGFELTGNGEFLIKDVNAVLAAKGTYTILNNLINGTYKLLSSGETISFTGTFDPATQKINCTLGSGTATKGQGKWVAIRK